MASPFQSVIQNAREEAMSSDLNRAQSLASQAAQNELMYDQLDSSSAPANCFTRTPVISGIGATMNVALGAGEAMVYDVSGVGVDDSAFKVMQWDTQTVGPLAAADPVNPRIDLLVMTPANVQTDNTVRNILQDPVTRAFAPASVPKTRKPTCVPVIVTGTPAGTPVPPAIPAGAFALYEINVPALAADSVACFYVPRLFQRAGYPWVSKPVGITVEEPQNGVVRGCKLLYFGGTGEALSHAGTTKKNQVVIDGELIALGQISNNNVNDSLNNPFAVAAPAGNDKPYYIYVCGGRYMPQNNGGTAPAILISSLTPPDAITGRPSAAIGTPRGNTFSAVFVGVGFVQKNTTNHQKCVATRDMVWCATTLGGDLSFEGLAPVGVGTNNITFASAPSSAVSDEMVVGLVPTTAGAVALMTLGTNAIVLQWSKSYASGLGTINDGLVRLPVNGAAPQLVNTVSGAAATLSLAALAYKVNVRRLG